MPAISNQLRRIRTHMCAVPRSDAHRERVSLERCAGDNVCALRDWFVNDDDSLVLVLECLTTDVGAIIQTSKDLLPIAIVRHILRGLLHGLALVHSKDVMHRDVKPSNILLDAKTPGAPCRVVLADFGLARTTAEAKTDGSYAAALEFSQQVQSRWYRGASYVLEIWHCNGLGYELLS